jgi:hypothetical protein
MDNFSMTIVFSTRVRNEQYVEHVKKSCACPNLELLVYENNGERSLTEIYNEALHLAKNDIIVFCHDDLFFDTSYWGKKLVKHFKRNPDYGIIGIAGTNHLIDGKWWSIRQAMHGIVNHSDGKRKWTSTFSQPQGNKIKQMVTLDGLFFAVDRKNLKHGFDKDFGGFHFYDLSFCIPNHLGGVKIGVVTDILVTHFSVGMTNQKWEENKKLLEKKYADKFPITI